MPRKVYNKKTYMRKRSKFASKFKPKVTIAVKKYVKRVIKNQEEMKYTYIESGPQDVENTGYTSNVVDWPLQGITSYGNISALESTEGTRVGNKIKVVSVNFRFQCYLDGDTTNMFRLVIFQWNPSNLLQAPVLGDIFLGIPGSFPVLSPLNPYTKGQYHILHDRIYNMVLGNTSQVIGNLFFTPKKLSPSIITFRSNTAGGLSASLEKGEIFVYALSDSSSAVTCPELNWTATLKYTDA